MQNSLVVTNEQRLDGLTKSELPSSEPIRGSENLAALSHEAGDTEADAQTRKGHVQEAKSAVKQGEKF